MIEQTPDGAGLQYQEQVRTIACSHSFVGAEKLPALLWEIYFDRKGRDRAAGGIVGAGGIGRWNARVGTPSAFLCDGEPALLRHWYCLYKWCVIFFWLVNVLHEKNKICWELAPVLFVFVFCLPPLLPYSLLSKPCTNKPRKPRSLKGPWSSFENSYKIYALCMLCAYAMDYAYALWLWNGDILRPSLPQIFPIIKSSTAYMDGGHSSLPSAVWWRGRERASSLKKAFAA